jgi:predicted TIM-barrel enzyme
MRKFKRDDILKKFRKMIKDGIPIIGGGAGTGISAKFEEEGGIDLIIIYNSGKYRMSGRGSLAGLLAFGNANEIVLDMAKEVIPVIKNTPVLAGVNGTDQFVLWDDFFEKLDSIGFSGIQNFPTVGLIDGNFRRNLEETGFGYYKEIEVIKLAHERDFLTTPYVFSTEDSIKMTEAGADIIVCHMGLTTKGSIGAKTAKTINECVDLINEWSKAAKKINNDIIVLCHGGPISTPSDVEYIFKNCPLVNGFYGASSMERLPVEEAIKQQTMFFKNIKVN